MRTDLSPSKDWMAGGTGITNFSRNQLPVYEEAIRRYGDFFLFVSDKPMAGHEGTFYYSFHDASSYKGLSLTEFWLIFDKVKKEQYFVDI